MVDVKIGGVWASSFAHLSTASWSSRYGDGPCGPDLATIVVEIDPRNDSELLHMGRTVEVWDQGVLKFGGPLTSPGNGSPRTIEAKGWARRDWDATLDPAPGARIGRDAYGRAVTPTADTTPRWTIDAHDLDISVADDRLFTRVVATYVSELGGEGSEDVTATVTTEDSVAIGLYGVLPFPLDLTPLGLIDAPTALGYAQQQLREFAVPEWTTRVTTTPDRLLTMTGHNSHLPDVEAGQMVRVYNAPTSFGGLRRQAAMDVVLGEVAYSTEQASQVTISPARVAVRSLADVVRQIAEARRKAEAA